jgi:hypothetical protein
LGGAVILEVGRGGLLERWTVGSTERIEKMVAGKQENAGIFYICWWKRCYVFLLIRNSILKLKQRSNQSNLTMFLLVSPVNDGFKRENLAEMSAASRAG